MVIIKLLGTIFITCFIAAAFIFLSICCWTLLTGESSGLVKIMSVLMWIGAAGIVLCAEGVALFVLWKGF